MSCSLKYENRRYTISTKENSDQCVVFEKGSSLPPLKGLVINTPQLHVPLSHNFFDMITSGGVKNVYKIDIRKALKIDNTREIIKFEAETINFPFVCKKHFSKKYFTKYANPTSNFISHMRLATPDNENETLVLFADNFSLPKKIKGHKVIKLGEEIIVSAKVVVCDVSKFETKTNLPVCTAPRITKRKFEVPYPIKLAAGFVAFFGVLEIGSALISKVVNKIK